jgi:hypothetical protein
VIDVSLSEQFIAVLYAEIRMELRRKRGDLQKREELPT